VTVTLSDALSAAAARTVNGFESTVAVSATTSGVVGVGNQLHINQAIKLAVNSDAVLNKLLIAEDGPGNTLVLRSLIDGVFAASDLQIAVRPLSLDSYNALGDAQKGEALAAYRAMLGDSSAGAGLSAAALATLLADDTTGVSTLMANWYNTNRLPVLAQQAGADITGAISIAENANRIAPGAGNDVIVLSTDASSIERIDYSGADIGNDVIVNFHNDTLNFDAYLSNVSQATGARIATNWADQGNIAGAFAANRIVVTNFATLDAANAATTLTYAALTGEQVLTELRTAGGFTVAALDAAVGTGVARKAVLMIQNSANAGAYQIFEVTFGNGAASDPEDFTSVSRLGEIDFGSALIVTTGTVSPTRDMPDLPAV